MVDGRAERDVRAIVADRLGVDPVELSADVSLIEDLAADSLDVADLGLALEAALGVDIPDSRLQEVRTYGDLLAAVAAGRRGARRAERTPVFARVRVVPGPGGSGGVERAGELDPYTVQVLVEDVLRAGPGARLEMEIRGDEATGAAARARFGELLARGVDVSVRRDGPAPRPAA